MTLEELLIVEAADRGIGADHDGADGQCVVLAGGRYRARIIRLDARYSVRRLVQWILLPLRRRAARRDMERSGARKTTCYCVFPNLAQPTIIYESRSPAEVYAESHLLPPDRRHLALLATRAVGWWLGCHPSIGAVILVGTLQ